MDGESSYESDISESWSLIDINSNEESLSATDSPCEVPQLTELENIKTKKLDDVEVENCNEAFKTEFEPLSCSDSNSSFVSEEFVGSSFREVEQFPRSSERNKEGDRRNDSDVESIEILDVDGNYRDSEFDRIDAVIDSHDSQTYQSDDEESFEENIKTRSRSSSSTVIKRKRRKCNKNSEDIVNSINSEDTRPDKNDSKVFMSESDTGNPSNALCELRSHPVYKHHRNNVANAVLSLSVGVIFAGVACIAIGHFLGVQDASENAGELVETLKKLQVENAALQSRLFHLNRALLNRETHSKPRLPPSKVSCKEIPEVVTSKTDKSDLDRVALSEIRSSLNSIELLSKLETLLRNENKETENGVALKGLEMYIHDQLNYLKSKREGGVKLLEDADRKISKVLQKIVTRLSTSQENIETLYQRLINLKDNLNHKLNKILPDVPEDVEVKRPNFEKRTPVTEHDLQSIQWKSKKESKKNYFGENTGPVVLYQFPQPENYYEPEARNLDSNSGKQVEVTNSTEVTKKVSFHPEKKEKKKHKFESEKRKQKKEGKINLKIKEVKRESKDKRHKRAAEKFNAKNSEKKNKKEKKILDTETVKLAVGVDFNKTGFGKTKNSKADAEVVKPKGKFKKTQKSKHKKLLPSKATKDFYESKRQSPPCFGFECFNSTGHWVFKWADGREEFRRHQKQGEWQFERAKGRKELRDEDDYSGNWQFKRAVARESNRQTGRWNRGKHTKFNGKEFFHEGFSWI